MPQGDRQDGVVALGDDETVVGASLEVGQKAGLVEDAGDDRALLSEGEPGALLAGTLGAALAALLEKARRPCQSLSST